MKRIGLIIVTVCFMPALVNAQDPMDMEMAPVIEKLKAAGQEEREAAVLEIVSLREAVSDELAKIVVDANNGRLGGAPKASALFLMGELGLLQSKVLLEQERDWKWTPSQEEISRFNAYERHRMPSLVGYVAKVALHRASFGGNVSLSPSRKKGTLSPYPSLQEALSNLRSAQRRTRRAAEDAVLRWYKVVRLGMNSVLTPSRAQVYSNEVKVTAAFVLGEFRVFGGQMLLWNIDLKDEKGISPRYASAVQVQSSDPEYPCAVAMLKLGFRANMDGCFSRIATKPQLSQATRERIVRVLNTIDKNHTKKIYESQLAGLLHPSPGWGGTEEERQKRLQLMRSVKHLIR